jgi:N-methylhydantoinase A
VAIDTGGTFTDCVYLRDGQIEVLKIPSTPSDPSLAVLNAVTQIAPGPSLNLRHGTTVGTNTMLERKGARVAFITTAGFEDTIAIGRQTRASLYDWFAPVPICIVPRELRFGVPERVSVEGKILRTPTDAELAALVEKVRGANPQAIAISLLFSFANPETERHVEAALRPLGLPISVSHRILPEFREYERAATTVVNAYLAPRIEHYLLNLQQRVSTHHANAPIDVMQSSGGTIPLRLAAQEPVRTILSGPAGGVIGATHMSRLAGFDRIIGCDMGGTSTDVFLADATSGGVQRTRESIVAGIPISVPMLDIHTVGAGGGSIARFDSGGMLRVGPDSAGMDPGPICFGRGTTPTVTDANLILGRLDLNSFLDGGVQLDLERTRRIMAEHKGPLATVEDFASGILRVIEAQMEKAIRVISIERGHDPRDFTLVPFGGGGPLHACALAQALHIPTVLVPNLPGALSAVGILLADSVRDYSQTLMLPGSAINHLADAFTALERQATTDFTTEGLEGTDHLTLDLRYRGQGYELNVPYDPDHPTHSLQAFHTLHHQRYGFSNTDKPIEIVNLRLRMIAVAERYAPPHTHPDRNMAAASYATPVSTRDIFFDDRFLPSNLYRRAALRPAEIIPGPAMITEYTSATILSPGCVAQVDGFNNLLIHIDQEPT